MVALLVGVLMLKVGLALVLAGHPLLQPVGDLDTGEYWRLAQRAVTGDPLLTGTPVHVSALYIYWLAFAVALTGGSTAGVLVLQAIAGTTAVWLVARTAAAWMESSTTAASRTAAVAAGASLALTGIVALQEALILQSALDPLLMAAFAWATTRAIQAPAPNRWALCGAALAVLATNRPNAWLLTLPCVAAIWWLAPPKPVHDRARLRQVSRAGGMWLVGVGVALAPFIFRAALATGEWHVLPSHGGLNVYIGNHAGANGTYTVVEGIRPSIAGQREDMHRIAEEAAGRPLSDAQVSRHFARGAMRWWQRAPGDALRLLAYKVWLTTHAWELPVNVSYAWFREQVLLLRLLPLGSWLLIPLGLVVSVVGAPWIPGRHCQAWRLFRWLLPTYLVSVAFFFVADRYRAPALVLCAIHTGMLAGMWRDREGRLPALPAAGARRRLVMAACVGLAVSAGNLVPLPFQLGEADADTRMALFAIDAGRDDDARLWIDRAAARSPAPGVTWLRAGLAWQARNDLEQAEQALREAHRLDGDQAPVAFALAEVLITRGKGAEAVPLLEHAERGGVRPDRTRLDLALARWQAGDEAGARATLTPDLPPEALPLLRARALASVEARHVDLAAWLLTEHRRYVKDDAEVAEKLGLMKAGRGEDDAAAALFEEAARSDPARATARFNLAIARLRQGRRSDAIAFLREALRLDPTYEQAAGALRELLASQP